jgi:mRNA interferase MazF
LDFNPQAGHEQAGHRPAIVLSPASYNARTSLLICCPITTQIKNYPFDIPLPSQKKPAVALSDQLKSVDWRARHATRKSTVSAAELAEVRKRAALLIGAP